MAAPPFLNLAGELFLSFGIVGVSGLFIVPLGLIFFLAACYSLYLFSVSQHGRFWFFIGGSPLRLREQAVL